MLSPERRRRWACACSLAACVLAAAAAALTPLYLSSALLSTAIAPLLLIALLAGAAAWLARAVPEDQATAIAPEPLRGPEPVRAPEPAVPEHVRRELESLRDVQRELLAAKQAAEAAMMAKGEFLATVSHEIRTPLNGIVPLLELLLSTPLAADQRDYLSTANSSARELLRIVDDILDYSKLEANKVELEAVGLNLRELLESVSQLLGRNAEAKGLRLAVSIDPGVRLAVRGDPVRLRQVLTNLVGNAIKFTERGGVSIHVSKRGETRTHHEILFAVRDSGVGISPEAAARLFQPFSQADSSTTRMYGGTGLGLVICKRLVDAMGGRIGVQSAPGRGSLFWFSVPLLKAPGDMQIRRDLAGTRTLLLSGDAVFRARLEGQLGAFGVELQHGSAPADALVQLRNSAGMGERWRHELLVVDADGLRGAVSALLRNIAREPTLDGLRVLLLGQPGVEPDARTTVLPATVGDGELRGALHRLLDVEADEAAPIERRPAPETITNDRVADEAPAAPAAPLRGHVLLVEDNEVNRRVAHRVLSLIGLTVDDACDGSEALRRLAAAEYDAVLMDCQMPVMDGYAATRERRRLENAGGLRHLPIIAMTANAMAGDREKCLAAGMDDYLTKPLDRGLLERMLRRWLPRDAATAKAAVPAVAQPAAAAKPTPAAAGTEATVGKPIDAATVAELVDLMGSDFGALVRAYVDDAPRQLRALEAAAANGDLAALVGPAHALKSSSANLGALALAEIAKRIEHGARRNDLDDAPALVARMSAEFSRVVAALRTLT